MDTGQNPELPEPGSRAEGSNRPGENPLSYGPTRHGQQPGKRSSKRWTSWLWLALTLAAGLVVAIMLLVYAGIVAFG